jgi:hypothetical protein
MWQLRINDPSGETRIIPLTGTKDALRGSIVIGKREEADVRLRDPSLPDTVATLWQVPNEGSSGQYWIRVSEKVEQARLGDLEIREAIWPEGLRLSVGETQLKLELASSEMALPSFPSNVRPWLTRSEEGKSVLWMTKKAAATPLSIYLAGETGTGKEVLAHLLHAWSDRASGPFVPLHCGALPIRSRQRCFYWRLHSPPWCAHAGA